MTIASDDIRFMQIFADNHFLYYFNMSVTKSIREVTDRRVIK